MGEEIRTEAIGVGVVPAGRREPLLRRTAWGAIFAGTFVAISCQLLLASLGLAIGAAAFGPESQAGNIGTFAGVWWILTAITSLFLGGLVTAWLAGFPRWVDGMIHGAVVWGLTVAVSAWLVTTGSAALAGGAMGTLQTARDGGQGMQGTPLEPLRQRTEQAFQHRTYGSFDDRYDFRPSVPDDARWTLNRMIPDPRDATQEERRRAAAALVDEYGYSPRDASRMVDQYIQTDGRGTVLGMQERSSMDRMGERATDFATNAATWTFFAILLGLGAAAFGGAIGRPQYLVEDNRRVL
jgi:hypothetical protein